jgi:hypothetical protein
MHPSVNYKATDLPPTPADSSMRLKHTNQSVDYNLGHLFDHSQGVIDSIKKMSTVNPAMAKKVQAKSVAVANDMMNNIKGGTIMAKATAPKPKKISIKKAPLPKFATGKISKPKGVSKGLAGYVVKQPSIVTKNAADNMQY